MERKLAAILAADVVGYSALMERDEAGTFNHLKAGRKELFEPEVKKHHGRIFKLMGDGLLAEFGSVIDAVECAVALQLGMERRNASIATGERIHVRIGVNLGEVIVDGKDRYGEGVNIATRLEQLAEPGGIWVSAKVAHEVERKLAFDLEPMGDRQAKNMVEPISAYRVVIEGTVSRESSNKLPVLPATPALAVLPFVNLSGDLEHDYFADGVVEDIITALSRFKSFAVIARNSSFVYKGRAVDVRQVSKELGVRYVLEGSVRRAGNRLRITAQLVDCATGAHLWAEHFDGGLDDVFDFQDRITESVATLVEPHIQAAEIERSRQERPGSVAAYDIYLQALAKQLTETERDNADAYALLTKGLALEPDNALLLAHASWALEHRAAMGWPPIGPDDRQRCLELARRGLDHAAGDTSALIHCAMSLIWIAKEYDAGMAILQSAVETNPNSLRVVTVAGIAHLNYGSIEQALALFQRAGRLSPRDPFGHLFLTGIAHVQMVLGNYTEALVWAARSAALNQNFDPTLWMLIAANAHLGRMGEAHHFLDTLRKNTPAITIAKIRAGQLSNDPSRIAAILDGLRIAGLEEG